MTPEERAEKIVNRFHGMTFSGGLGTEWLKSIVAAEIKAAVEEALARRDLEQFGESFVLGGKRIRPNEIYKSTADYVREAKAEAYEEGFQAGLTNTPEPSCNEHVRLAKKEAYEEAAKLIDATVVDRGDGILECLQDPRALARQIRALKEQTK